MAKILLEMPDEMQAAVDRARGLVPRNAWIREAIDLHLSDSPRVRTPEPTPSKPPPPINDHREFLERRGPTKEQPVIHKFEAISKYDPRCKHCNQRERTH